MLNFTAMIKLGDPTILPSTKKKVSKTRKNMQRAHYILVPLQCTNFIASFPGVSPMLLSLAVTINACKISLGTRLQILLIIEPALLWLYVAPSPGTVHGHTNAQCQVKYAVLHVK